MDILHIVLIFDTVHANRCWYTASNDDQPPGFAGYYEVFVPGLSKRDRICSKGSRKAWQWHGILMQLKDFKGFKGCNALLHARLEWIYFPDFSQHDVLEFWLWVSSPVSSPSQLATGSLKQIHLEIGRRLRCPRPWLLSLWPQRCQNCSRPGLGLGRKTCFLEEKQGVKRLCMQPEIWKWWKVIIVHLQPSLSIDIIIIISSCFDSWFMTVSVPSTCHRGSWSLGDGRRAWILG